MSVFVLETYTVFNLSNGDVFICFNMIINENKFELKVGTSKIRFLGCWGQDHSCYGNDLIFLNDLTQIIKKWKSFSLK